MIKKILLTLSLILFVYSYIVPINTQALEQVCSFLFVMNCKDKTQDQYIKELLQIDVKEVKSIPENQKELIINYLKSDDKEKVREGLTLLFTKSVKPQWDKYIYGKSNKDEREDLKKFFKKMEGARQSVERDHSPLVNSWGMLGNAVNFGVYITSTLFLDIQTQLPDVFGRFDYKDQSKTLTQKLTDVFTIQAGQPLQLDSVKTLNFNTIYYSMVIIPILIYGLKILIDFFKVGYYSWESIFEVLKQYILFFVFIISIPYLVSFLTLGTNALNIGVQESFSSFSVADSCKDDRTLLCAYKLAFTNTASSEAVFAKESQIVSVDDDKLQYITILTSEIFNGFFLILVYLLNILFGLVVLMFWKGVVIVILINIMILSIIAPYAMLNSSWRANWFRKLLSNLVKCTGFVIVFNLATQLVLALSTSTLAFWSVSFIFILSGVLIFSSQEILSEVFEIDLSLNRKAERQGKTFLKTNQIKQQSKRAMNYIKTKFKK